MVVGEPVIDEPAVTAGGHNLRGAQETKGLGHGCFQDARGRGQVAHAQLARLEQRMEKPQTRWVSQHPEPCGDALDVVNGQGSGLGPLDGLRVHGVGPTWTRGSLRLDI